MLKSKDPIRKLDYSWAAWASVVVAPHIRHNTSANHFGSSDMSPVPTSPREDGDGPANYY